ncbi:MAG: hypothetical protein KIS62_11860 [Ramlibacter sp.]|nr:hypothetical protein [Ramlibacter sp.]MCW5650435.1 hypothetical protein [Ramlibacter sp.]
MPPITVTRRANVVALYQTFLQERIAAGDAPKGLDQTFAALLEISPSMWSQIKSARPISDKLARQIEHHTQQAAGWLDQDHGAPPLPDAAEDRFLELARNAWRQANAKRKRELLHCLKSPASPTSSQ